MTTKKIGGFQRTVKKMNSKRILKSRLDKYIAYRKTLKKLANNLHKSRQIKPKTLNDEHHKQTTNYAYAYICHAIWTIDQAILALETIMPELARKKAPFYYEIRYDFTGSDQKKQKE